MSQSETTEYFEGFRLKILNNTDEEMVLQAQKIEKGKYKKGHQSPEQIGPYEEKSCELVACDGSCTGGADIEGWLQYKIGCSEGKCKLHFKYLAKLDKVSYSCECQMHEGKMLCETMKDKKNDRTVNWIIGPKE